MTTKLKISIIGAGGVATSIVSALQSKCNIVQIFSRNIDNALKLSSAIDGCIAIDDLKKLDNDVDIVIIAVKDDAISGVISNTANSIALWLHTSGSTPIDVFYGKRSRYGVLYPMQSFSRDLPVDMSKVHFFIEGKTAGIEQEINNFARLMSNHVVACDSNRREKLHIAGVFACNFANYMWTLSSDVLRDANIDFRAMLPLIESTVQKLYKLSPEDSQTGPAARNDRQIIEKHLASLDKDKKEIYQRLTESIINRYNKR